MVINLIVGYFSPIVESSLLLIQPVKIRDFLDYVVEFIAPRTKFIKK